MSPRVVLVRPWTDAHGGAGCCGGDVRGGVCLERPDGRVEHDPAALLVADVFGRLREEVPEVDVQVVSASNTAYLLPSVFRAARRRGLRTALRDTSRATTPGGVLVDGQLVGELADLGVEGVLAEVRRRVALAG